MRPIFACPMGIREVVPRESWAERPALAHSRSSGLSRSSSHSRAKATPRCRTSASQAAWSIFGLGARLRERGAHVRAQSLVAPGALLGLEAAGGGLGLRAAR